MTDAVPTRSVRSCGVLLFRDKPRLQFLLMKHTGRFDLPKGHMERGETELQCALREMEEETTIRPADVHLDPNFRFEHRYIVPSYRRHNSQRVEKTVIIFLGYLLGEVGITCSEHQGFHWFDWLPPQKLQEYTIDPLLDAVALHFQNHGYPREGVIR